MTAASLLLLTLVDGFIVSSPILRADVARTHAYMKVDYDKTPILRAGVARTYAYMKVDYDKTLEGDYPHPHDDGAPRPSPKGCMAPLQPCAG